jgi:hypothetical protein
MRVLSKCSFIASFVLVVSLFDGVNAATPVSGALITLDKDLLTALVGKITGDSKTLGNVLQAMSAMIKSDAAECQTLFADIVTAYQNGLSKLVIPEAITSHIPAEILSVICIQSNGHYTLNPSVLSTMGTIMETLETAVKNEVAEIKKEGCRVCCCNFWKAVPTVLLDGAEFVAPILLQVADAYITKGENIPGAKLEILIPAKMISRPGK